MGIMQTAGQFISGEYKENALTVWNLILGWKYFLEHEVVVGITEESNVSEGAFTSAGLLYMHNNGVPSRNIPARPVLGPALAQEDIAEAIRTMMMDAAENALVKGDMEKCAACFEKAGMLGRDACKNYVMGGHLAPNAESTIRKKGSSRPLIDTGAMVESISYAVRKK